MIKKVKDRLLAGVLPEQTRERKALTRERALRMWFYHPELLYSLSLANFILK